jgi:hypothetical protein
MSLQLLPQSRTAPSPVFFDISDEQLRQMFLEAYHPGCRYLRRVDIDLPVGTGYFQMDYNYFAKDREKIGHFTASEHVTCFNQLGFVYFARALMTNYFPKFPHFEPEELVRHQKGTLYIMEIHNISYKRPVDCSREFVGEMITVDHWYKPAKELMIARTYMNVDDGAALADITVGLKL